VPTSFVSSGIRNSATFSLRSDLARAVAVYLAQTEGPSTSVNALREQTDLHPAANLTCAIAPQATAQGALSSMRITTDADGTALVVMKTAACFAQPAGAALSCRLNQTYVIGSALYAYVGTAAELGMEPVGDACT